MRAALDASFEEQHGALRHVQSELEAERVLRRSELLFARGDKLKQLRLARTPSPVPAAVNDDDAAAAGPSGSTAPPPAVLDLFKAARAGSLQTDELDDATVAAYSAARDTDGRSLLHVVRPCDRGARHRSRCSSLPSIGASSRCAR